MGDNSKSKKARRADESDDSIVVEDLDADNYQNDGTRVTPASDIIEGSYVALLVKMN